ncbi:MAG: phage major capsid protein [Clostridiales bacterium]|nr:phage major capsid protein [Candidatus Apopatousia equi]
MVTLTSADNALKKIYLEVVSNQLNDKVNPLLSKIEQTTADVFGKEIIKIAPFGINGGIGAGTEDGALPTASSNSYVKFVSELKNLYGKIEISDKAVRASEHSVGAFVNLLNAEMEGLIKASTFNFGRMLYGDGSGKIGTIKSVSNGVLTLDTVKSCIEGMVVDFYAADGTKISAMNGAKITSVDRKNKAITVSKTLDASVVATGFITVQGSKDNELTGLGKIFASTGTLYGVDRSTNAWLVPHMDATEKVITDAVIQEAIDALDENVGSQVDYISCSYDVKRFYQNYLSQNKRNIDIMDLEGGYKAMSYSGVPVVADRFVEDGTMYLLNTKDFALHQLCDWQWLEGEDGKVLKQNAGYATYAATLVKYADLICDKPAGQAKISGIVESIEEETEEEPEVDTEQHGENL